MDRVRLLPIVVTVVILAGGSMYGENWKVGQKWTYEHKGPRPYSDPSAKIEGDRTIEVMAITGEGAQRRHAVKNRWGKNDRNPATSYIDPNDMIHKVDIELLGVVLFAPPIPATWSQLKVGREEVLKTTMDFAGFSIAMEFAAKRLKDETITVPAGEFKNCRHVRVVSSMPDETGQTRKNRVDVWYHPKTMNFVKEVIVTNYQSQNSYSGTSVLKSYTRSD